MLDELRQEHPDSTITATADITKLDEIARAIDALRAELKQIDLAIVCSGTGDINASLDYAVERPAISLLWVMPVDKVANQIISAIRKKKSKAYVTKRWHVLAIINKNLPFVLYKRI